MAINLWHCWDLTEAQVVLLAAFSSSVFLHQIFLVFLLSYTCNMQWKVPKLLQSLCWHIKMNVNLTCNKCKHATNENKIINSKGVSWIGSQSSTIISWSVNHVIVDLALLEKHHSVIAFSSQDCQVIPVDVHLFLPCQQPLFSTMSVHPVQDVSDCLLDSCYVSSLSHDREIHSIFTAWIIINSSLKDVCIYMFWAVNHS